jgi:hypothetical protein
MTRFSAVVVIWQSAGATGPAIERFDEWPQRAMARP